LSPTTIEVEFLVEWKCAHRGERRSVTADCAAVWVSQDIAKFVSVPPMNKMVENPPLAK